MIGKEKAKEKVSREEYHVSIFVMVRLLYQIYGA